MMKRPYRESVDYPINKNKELVFMIIGIRKIAVDTGAIVFGGAIRDEIIRDHHAKQFYQKGGMAKEYLDPKVFPDHIGRLIVPRDLDLYFGTESLYTEFCNRIQRQGFRVFNDPHTKPIYNIPGVKKMTLMIHKVVGKTFTFHGIGITLKVDCVINNGANMEPPFRHLDFWCNSLVEDRSGIRLSRNTGTPVDHMNAVQKAISFSDIMSQIIGMRANGVFNWFDGIDSDDIDCNHLIREATFRICKMTNKGFNVNCKSIKKDYVDEGDDKICVICQENISGDSSKLNTIQMHYQCFRDYMSSAVKLKDPYNQPIEFSAVSED